MKKLKPFVVLLSAVLLVAATVLGTVAYLTDSDEVVNTFTVGNVDIKLDEAVVDTNGVPTGERKEQGNEYHLIPGQSYVKDPTVTVIAGSESSYVRMIVTVNCYDELVAIFGDPFLPENFVEGWDSTLWVSTGVIDVDDAANTATYEFRYFTTVKPEKTTDLVLPALFTNIVVPTSMTGEQLATIADLEITVEAHAIQATGFADADAAWGEFTK